MGGTHSHGERSGRNEKRCMKLISLTKGKFAIVDDQDYDFLAQWNWHTHADGYACRNEKILECKNRKRKLVMMHRIITKAPSDKEVDHIDMNGFNNTRSNLRISSKSQNGMNRKPRKNKTSKYKGVSWHIHHDKWQARISCRKKLIHLGFYKKEKDAAIAYDTASLKFHGKFSRTNFKRKIK